MDHWRGVLIVGLLMAGLLLSGEVEQSQGAVACSTVIQDIVPCAPFLMAGASPPPFSSPCCSGVRDLDKLADVSVENRRDICRCLESTAQISMPNPAAVAALLRACGVTRSVDVNQDCDTLP